MEVFNVHTFLYTLASAGTAKDHQLLILSKTGEHTLLTIDTLQIASSALICTVITSDQQRHIIPFVRILKIYDPSGELVFDTT